jgi:hypothetical protein
MADKPVKAALSTMTTCAKQLAGRCVTMNDLFFTFATNPMDSNTT